MFGIKIQGRLGNQLFQYAYARVLSAKFNTPFFFLRYKYFYVNKYFDISIDSPVQNALKRISFNIRNFFIIKQVTEDQFQPPVMNISQEQNNVIYVGFYQSTDYHSQMTGILKKELKIKDAYKVNLKDFVHNEKQTIVVHVRRTDYITFGGDHLGGIDLTLSLEYYQRALEQLPVETCNVLFLSDDISFVKEHFHFPNAIYASKNTEITDLQLIMQADYLVLANSSFSWWGAYLNTKVKKVVVPKYWLGIKIHIEHPAGIVNSDWVRIE